MDFQQNNLNLSSSLYLQQHADQPVHWQEWNTATLNHAKKLNKPLIISIGYSTCHWCHVMAHEAFSDAQIAQYMNAHFICIKVDRETHPDIDQIYMKAAQAFTGQGGWPLNCFALPNGKPFHGGLYFKERDWLNTLHQIQKLYSTNYAAVVDFATQITSTLQQQDRPQLIPVATATSQEIREVILDLKEEFDSDYGGFKGSPKFPLPDTWLSLAQLNHHLKIEKVSDHLNKTAETFLTKGINDIVDGGWFRYSVTADWNWPHFEKMLYDQGLILSFLVHQQVEKKYLEPHVSFLLNTLKSDKSLFFAGIDADSNGVEGGYYLFSHQSFKNFNLDLIHLRKSDDLQHIYVDSYPDLDLFKKELKQRCLALRSEHHLPIIDTKEIVAWNAITLQGLLQYGIAYQDSPITDQAIHLSTEFYHCSVSAEGRVKRLATDSKHEGYLDDHVFTAQLCFWAYQATQKEEWLLRSKQIVESSIDLFYNASTPLFNFSSYLHANTFIVPRETQDNVIPSSNSVFSDLLFKLSPVFGDNEWHKISQAMNESMQATTMQNPINYTHWLSNLLHGNIGPKDIYIIGPNAQKWLTQLPGSIRLKYAVYTSNDNESQLFSLKQKANTFQKDTFAMVCKDYHCSNKLNSFKELCTSIG